MKNICLIIEYLGKNYCGYQKQINGITIQSVLEDAIEKALGKRVDTYASGRTDSGVNALAQVVNFESDTTILMDKIPLCINRHLPDDIRVISASEKPSDFNSRFSAKSKTYEYRIINGRPLSVFEKGRAVEYTYKLDFDLLQKACDKITGEHDFSSFMASKSNIKDNTIRTVYELTYTYIDNALTFTIRGNGFLYNMVRIIIGTVLDIARGQLSLDIIDKLFEGKTRQKAGITMPAEGLYLKKVEY